MPVPSPEIRRHRNALARTQIGAVGKPVLVTSTMPPMPADAGRTTRLADALHRKRCGLGLLRPPLKLGNRGNLGIEQIEIRKFMGQQRRIGETDIFIVGRHARHGDRALGQSCNAVTLTSFGRTPHGLTPSDQDPQSDIVALGALGFLDAGRHAPQPLAKRRGPRPRRLRPAPARLAASTRRCASVLSAV